MSDRTTRAAVAPDATRAVEGGFTVLDDGPYYRITSVDGMPPFLMTIASASDLWMFVTSRGGLTAGRRDAAGALFPYETADKLNDGHHHTGPVTLVRVRTAGGDVLWRPFAERHGDRANVVRSLYKNPLGNRVVFEEVHEDLGLVFRCRWSGADPLGFVRTAWLENRGPAPVHVAWLDGLRNILPWGAPLALYQQSSSLVDAYKRCDLDRATGLGVFSLESRITDRAEPAESLRANVVWCHGVEGGEVALDGEAIAAFERDEPFASPVPLTGRRGHYLVRAEASLAAGAVKRWHLVADVGRSHADIATLAERLRAPAGLDREIETALDAERGRLARLVASADGVQLTARPESDAHHAANVLFNIMRGGVYASHHEIEIADLRSFLRTRNRPVGERHAAVLDGLPATVGVAALTAAAADTGDPDFERLAYEYLPLHFGRRHGDPSRPWNRFSIRVRDDAGRRALHYEGNWRDVFQNWEALSASFPGFLPNLVAKFVNASTVDGYNPYRITRDGVEWEVIDPRDPWSYIGYWGDHQIVYLLRLLEAWSRYEPAGPAAWLDRAIFSYADVPYRIAPYAAIVADPHATITFDTDRAGRVEDRVNAIGTDGRLLHRAAGSVHHANLFEKLLVPALAKLSNYVADAGIWMNTQRPEWNDANNALAGNGVSAVTMYHLRRYLRFFEGLLRGRDGERLSCAPEVAEWMRAIHAALAAYREAAVAAPLDDRQRRALLDALGGAYEAYRTGVYANGFSDPGPVAVSDVLELLACAGDHLDHAIRRNRRDDGLYHAYHVVTLSPDGREAAVRPLGGMLEGQAALLGAGVVDASESLRVLDALAASDMMRPDQGSFMLYPARPRPTFMERNRVPVERARAVPLLARMLEAGERSVIEQDATGVCRFHADFANARDVAAALDRLAADPRWTAEVERDRAAVLALFERVFDHHAFTGRSGTMYGYEGIGCIYWHMVAKLLLAVQETLLEAERAGRPAAERDALARHYFAVRAGLGYERTVASYGAFPTDPYSHTPAHAGAQQPGMTGQVKEEILTRLGELGVRIEDGCVRFAPRLLRRAEFTRAPAPFRYHDRAGQPRTLELPAERVAFTLCEVPVVYACAADAPWIRVHRATGAPSVVRSDTLGREDSRALFGRTGGVLRLDVGVAHGALRDG